MKEQRKRQIEAIGAFFDSNNQKQFKPSEMASILAKNKASWELPNITTVSAFTRLLLESKKMVKLEFTFPSRKETRYTWGPPKLLPTILSLREGAYFSHYTAMHLHGLTEQLPKTIYLSIVQSPPRDRPAQLNQASIDMAFKRAPRASKAVAELGEYRITLLNPMGIGKTGITDIEWNSDKLVVTDLEKTLIDAVVRPHYAGGVYEVAKAYREAAPHISINRLMALLAQLQYVYPYHQAVGYYAERSGQFSESQLKLIEKKGLEYDFYLTHNIKETDYVKRWRLYVPKGM